MLSAFQTASHSPKPKPVSLNTGEIKQNCVSQFSSKLFLSEHLAWKALSCFVFPSGLDLFYCLPSFGFACLFACSSWGVFFLLLLVLLLVLFECDMFIQMCGILFYDYTILAGNITLLTYFKILIKPEILFIWVCFWLKAVFLLETTWTICYIDFKLRQMFSLNGICDILFNTQHFFHFI